MNVQRTASAAFTAAFENEQELRDEHRANLSFGALRLPTSETVALDTVLLITLRGPWGGETFVQARVVAALPDGLALAVEGNADEILARLLANPSAQPWRITNHGRRARAPGIGYAISHRWRRSFSR